MRWVLRSTRERRIEGAAWGIVLVWLGVMMAMPERPDGLPTLGVGAILLSSAVAQAALRYDAGALTWGAGAVLTAIGLQDILDIENLPLFAIALIVLGVYVFVRAVMHRPGRPDDAAAGSTPHPPDQGR